MENTKKGILKSILSVPVKVLVTDRFACSQKAGTFLFGKKDFAIINNAIEVKKYIFNEETREKIRTKLNLNNKFVIGHVGRLSIEKNHLFLLDVFAQVHNKCIDSVLLLVGEGALKLKIKEKVKALGLEDNVVFLGVCSNVNEIYQAMDVFVLPSLFEGLPTVGIEAQTAGLMCFFSDEVTPEVKVTNFVQFISLKNNASYWSEQILKYSNGYKRYDKSEILIQAGYDIKNTAKQLEDFYLNSLTN
jgi:glycosyltransferase involved in cell wall biosynthesis